MLKPDRSVFENASGRRQCFSLVPCSLATADGMPSKTEEAILMHIMEAGTEHANKPPANETVYAYDGNATLQALLKSKPGVFEKLALYYQN